MNTVSGQQISFFEASFTTHKTSPSWNFNFFLFRMAHLTNPSVAFSAMLIQGVVASFGIISSLVFAFVIGVFFLFCSVNSFVLSHFFPSRYKNPIDIPLGNSKQKIKSLKARVSDHLLSFEAFFSLHLVHEVSPSSVLLIIWGCYDRHGRRCC